MNAREKVRRYMMLHGFKDLHDFNGDVYRGKKKELVRLHLIECGQIWNNVIALEPTAEAMGQTWELDDERSKKKTKKQGSSGYPAARPLFDHDGDLHGARLHILLSRAQVKRMVATQLDAGICVPRGRAGVRRLVRDFMMHKVLDALDPDPRAKWEPTEQSLDLSEACLVICGSPAP